MLFAASAVRLRKYSQALIIRMQLQTYILKAINAIRVIW